ncbi:MAG TPA: hypothetical protein VK025_03425 [Steroidobacter sp.]|nr:hypothetical protein [Steroidobacteraceae bacterium]HLS80434.1 hypothetical protein [Steroidobacter sp.]
MKFHSKLVGALDAVILSLSALVTLALLLALVNPTTVHPGADRPNASAFAALADERPPAIRM